jgi:hypothetical protein
MVVYQGARGAPVQVPAGNSSEVSSVTRKTVDPVIMRETELLPPVPVAGPPTGQGGMPDGPMPQNANDPGKITNYGIHITVR